MSFIRRWLPILSIAALSIIPGARSGAQLSPSHGLVPIPAARAELPADSAGVPMPGSMGAEIAARLGGSSAGVRNAPVGGALLSLEARRASSLRRSVTVGALIGAAAGTVTGLTVLAMCDSYCDESRGRGLMLHIGVGAVAGGVAGALIDRVRK